MYITHGTPGSVPGSCSGGALDYQPRLARQRFAEAEAGVERAHMNVYLAVARQRVGQRDADDTSPDFRRNAGDGMAVYGIVNHLV
jgi:hypothetical protein